MFNRSAILRAAHATARWLRGQAIFPRSYASCLSEGLRSEWRKAKEAAARAVVVAAEAEREAAVPPLSADVIRRVTDLRLFASVQSFTSSGTRQFHALLAEADDIARAARCMMIPALDSTHVAH